MSEEYIVEVVMTVIKCQSDGEGNVLPYSKLYVMDVESRSIDEFIKAVLDNPLVLESWGMKPKAN